MLAEPARRRRGAVGRRGRRLRGVVADLAEPADARSCSPSASWSNASADELAGLITDEHGKVLSDALGEVQRGLEVVEFACGIPQPAQGRVLRPGLDRRRHLLVPGAARRRRRHHAVQLPGDGPDVDVPGRHRLRQHLRAQAQRAGPLGVAAASPSCGSEAGLPDGVFNVVHGDKEAVDALLDHPDVAAVSFVGLDADRAVHPRARHRQRQAGAGARRRQEPRRSSCPTPTSTSPPSTWPPPRSARPASGAWRSRPRSPSASAARRAWSRRSASKARAVTVGSGRDAASEMGPVVTRGRPGPDRRPDRHRRDARARRLAVDGRGLVGAGPRERASSSARPSRRR